MNDEDATGYWSNKTVCAKKIHKYKIKIQKYKNKFASSKLRLSETMND